MIISVICHFSPQTPDLVEFCSMQKHANRDETAKKEKTDFKPDRAFMKLQTIQRMYCVQRITQITDVQESKISHILGVGGKVLNQDRIQIF